MNIIKKLNNAFYKLFSRSSFTGMTIDKDDIKIVKNYLKKNSEYHDEHIIIELEKYFAEYNQNKFAFSFLKGRVALYSIIYALGLNEGDEVIIPGYTCVVVPNAFNYHKIKLVHCDIELDTFGLDFDDLKKKVTFKTKAILIHHLYGLICRDLEKIIEFAKENKINIIEDCAHSLGASYNNVKVGNFGVAAFFSFEVSKVISCYLGGIAVTNDQNIATKIKEFQKSIVFPDNRTIINILINLRYQYLKNKSSFNFIFKILISALISKKRIISTSIEEEEGKLPDNYFLKLPAPLAAISLNQLKKLDLYNQRRIKDESKTLSVGTNGAMKMDLKNQLLSIIHNLCF
jgi:perosamine synthetase